MTRVAILGFGTEGRVAYEYFRPRVASVDSLVVLDRDEDRPMPPGVRSVRGERYLDDLEGFDLIVRSPGIDPRLLPTELPVTSTARYFMDHCPARVIGVTGTDTDTAANLIAVMLRAAGNRVWEGGNLPGPPLAVLDSVTPEDLVVFGISSFQLQDMSTSPEIAVVLDVEGPDLKYHRDTAEYLGAKAGIALHQREDDVMVFHPDDAGSRAVADASVARKQPSPDIRYGHVSDGVLRVSDVDILPLSKTPLASEQENRLVSAAVTAVWNVVDDPRPLRSALAAFEPAPHRTAMGKAE